MPFTKASKTLSKLRLALVGASGSGKTYSALAIATGLGARIALIDTERGSACKYAGLFPFDTLTLTSFHPQKFIDALAEAAKAAYHVVIIDSLSHAWIGKDGALDLVDQAAKRSKTGSSFNAWRDVTPLQTQLVDAILGAPIHVIATMRTKTEYVLEQDSRGKTVPRKVGLAPVQRDGLEYEFDLVGELDHQNSLSITKSRCPGLSGTVIQHPGTEFGRSLAAWLTDGTDANVATLPGNGSIDTLAPVDQARVLIEQATTDAELRGLLPRIKALPPREQAALRTAYAARKEALNVPALRQ